MTPSPIPASALYAHTQGSFNSGMWRCHFCGACCSELYEHDDPRREVGQKRLVFAMFPANPWMCRGCWLWRRTRLELTFLDGSRQTKQCPRNHSWFLSSGQAFAITPHCYPTLYDKLINPPRCFSLSLLEGSGSINHLQLTLTNNLPCVLANTPLRYTINGVPHTYTVYELEEGARNDEAGIEPGSRELLRYLGIERQKLNQPEKRKKGKQPDYVHDNRRVREVVQASGAVLTI